MFYSQNLTTFTARKQRAMRFPSETSANEKECTLPVKSLGFGESRRMPRHTPSCQKRGRCFSLDLNLDIDVLTTPRALAVRFVGMGTIDHVLQPGAESRSTSIPAANGALAFWDPVARSRRDDVLFAQAGA
jgi:hypothetical protein